LSFGRVSADDPTVLRVVTRARPVARQAGLGIAATLTAVLIAGAASPAIAAPSPFWPHGDWLIDAPFADDDDARPAPGARPRRPKAARPRPAAPKPAIAAAKPKGPLVIAISLNRQTMKVYDQSGLFAHSKISSGKASHPTPKGVFTIIQKNKWHRSNIYSGAPMPYMQRLTWSGIALHGGFVPGYPASHGCVRMPDAFAAQLWTWTRRGARVVVTDDDVAPADFSHPLLNERLVEAKRQLETPEANAPSNYGLRPTLGAAPASLRTADAGPKVDAAVTSDLATAAALPASTAEPQPDTAPSVAAEPAPAAAPKRTGPISVFVSRKDARLYVRQDFEPLFDVPMTFVDGDRPLGTHVFTARNDPRDKSRLIWNVLSLPEGSPRKSVEPAGKTERRRDARRAAATEFAPPIHSAADALGRLNIPDDAMAKIAAALIAGSSIIVADQGLKSGETGRGTEFILHTH